MRVRVLLHGERRPQAGGASPARLHGARVRDRADGEVPPEGRRLPGARRRRRRLPAWLRGPHRGRQRSHRPGDGAARQLRRGALRDDRGQRLRRVGAARAPCRRTGLPRLGRLPPGRRARRGPQGEGAGEGIGDIRPARVDPGRGRGPPPPRRVRDPRRHRRVRAGARAPDARGAGHGRAYLRRLSDAARGVGNGGQADAQLAEEAGRGGLTAGARDPGRAGDPGRAHPLQARAHPRLPQRGRHLAEGCADWRRRQGPERDRAPHHLQPRAHRAEREALADRDAHRGQPGLPLPERRRRARAPGPHLVGDSSRSARSTGLVRSPSEAASSSVCRSTRRSGAS